MHDDVALSAYQRLDLIERMLAESRRGFDTYAWMFLLWGCGHTAALLWQWYLPDPRWSWLLMVVCAVFATVGCIRSSRRQRAESRLGQANAAIWLAFAAGMVVALGCDRQHPLESFFVLYGVAQIASGMAMRYGLQALVGCCWLALGAAVLLTSSRAIEHWGFLAMAVFGEILFGTCGMRRERREREQASHV